MPLLVWFLIHDPRRKIKDPGSSILGPSFKIEKEQCFLKEPMKCTIGKAMNIKQEIFFCKKSFCTQFQQKQIIPFWKGEKVSIFCHTIFSIEKCHFFPFWAKHLERLVQQSSGFSKRNLENNIFLAAAIHCELWYLK